MTQHAAPSFDPVAEPETVREIRAVRRRLWEESGRDLAEYVRRAKETADRVLREAKERRDRRGAA